MKGVLFMKTLIIRKPKFMRSDAAVKAYIDIAESISKTMCESEMTLDEQYEQFKKLGECLNKAAKAGGFFTTKDFLKWMEMQNNA